MHTPSDSCFLSQPPRFFSRPGAIPPDFPVLVIPTLYRYFLRVIPSVRRFRANIRSGGNANLFVFTKSLLVRTLGSTQNTVPLTEANVGTGPRKRYSGAHASAAVVPAQGGDPNGSGRGPRVRPGCLFGEKQSLEFCHLVNRWGGSSPGKKKGSPIVSLSKLALQDRAIHPSRPEKILPHKFCKSVKRRSRESLTPE